MLQENLSAEEVKILELLKSVMDPEVAVNIVDLGLIYEIHFEENKKVHIVTTLSTRGCPLGDVIMQNIEVVLQNAYPGLEISVELTWEPEWTPEMITEDGRRAIEL